jgi:hypothetical protein
MTEKNTKKDLFFYDLDTIKYENYGVALLFRNVINSRNGSFMYTIFPVPEINLEQKPVDENTENAKKKDEYLFHHDPVAKGITAVLAAETSHNNHTLPLKIGNISILGKENIFKEYLNKSIRHTLKELKDSPDNYSDEEAQQIALKGHLELEQSNLLASEVYYNESNNASEKPVKKLVHKYVESYFEWLDKKINKRTNQIAGLKCLSQITTAKLKVIFNNLKLENVVTSADEEKFLAIFTKDFIGKVSWNNKINGAKSGLFDLMERVTGNAMKASQLKNYFEAEKIHDNMRVEQPGKLIDRIMKGI